MGLIDPMYQYSLDFYANLIRSRLAKSPKDEDVAKRILIIIEDITRSCYLNICRGLFEDHKMIFSFLICSQILRSQVHSDFINKQSISPMEWSFVLRGIDAGTGILKEPAKDGDSDDEGECVAISRKVVIAKWGER
jgi:dynein heavy chain, axonemal